MAVQIEAPEAIDIWTRDAALRELAYRLRQAGCTRAEVARVFFERRR